MPKDSWFAYHSSCDPIELLILARPVCYDPRSINSRVSWVNRYDWGYSSADPFGAARFFADIAPDAGWAKALKKKQQKKRHRSKKKPRTTEQWDRLLPLAERNTFLFDAGSGAEVLKLLAKFVSFFHRTDLF